MNRPKQKSPFYELMFNILIPTLILNYGTKYFGAKAAVPALVVALLIPLSYTVLDFYQQKKINIFGVFGFFNILMTGTLALLQAEGSVMVMKETLLPLTLGLIVLATSYTKKPLINALLLNPQIFRVDVLNERLEEKNQQSNFKQHLKKSNWLFAGSFLLSAALNYFLAFYIFKPIDPTVVGDARSEILNQQIAQMTSLSYAVILIPSFIFLAFVLWHLFHGIKKMTGLEMKELIKDQSK